MAKQVGDIMITGTIDDLCFYKMDGKYYVRMKSSLTQKKFWKDKAFERSKESCKRFSEGNKLASKVYRMIDEEKRKYKLFCFLKRKAIALLKEGQSLIEAEEVLMDYLKEFGIIEKNKCEASIQKDNYSNSRKNINQPNKSGYHVTTVVKILPSKMSREIYACAAGPPKVIGI